jgi:hypothetical protein
MAEETKNTGNPRLINSFIKGMQKDATDVYVPDGVWFNAINAINNAHNGELGAIGNEQSNLECSTFPYTVIGIIHKTQTEWVIFSTDNLNSEIGIFDEADCSYRTLVNDACLNFSTFNLITGAVKENYDCSYSVYWQDNLNPDRVMNLDSDKIPYICYPQLVNVDKKWNTYTVTKASPQNPCGTALSVSGGGIGTNTYTIAVGPTYGLVTLYFCSYTLLDKWVVNFDGVDVIDTGCVGAGGPGGSTPGVGPGTRCSAPATATFMKASLTETITVTVFGGCAGQDDTVWDFLIGCPDASAPGTPPMPIISTGIFYMDENELLVEVPSLDYGQSVTICALEGSLDVTNIAEGYDVSEPGDVCLNINELIPDPDACGAECCTSELDCDALRLHPLIQQPCVTVNKSAGSGQLNNGSYQAVIAYSENGIKLTDYSMPSNAQSLWDHTGIGGSIDIIIDNLDLNFDEYELVVIATINQQSVAKKIGYYSTTQRKVHLDLYNASLITVELSLIPLRKVIYEKSEKMFDIAGYLLRSGVTSQPFINYQPLANLIQANWVAVEYPASYYWDGGHEVGYYRDEVYSFFIRWVYKTGARSASFHIPGRQATASDLVLLPISNPDLLINTRRRTWQVYDTSSITSTPAEDRPDGGVIVARGDMAYWESSELYPNNHPEIWGDLCNEPIRHHKMPSNETIHIHDTTGTRIIILGVEFTNIKQPVDNDGVPVEDIVGYEILRGSREGNRSILAKGMFNNMIQYDMQNTVTLKGLFQNYPYNDVTTVDPFLQSYNNQVNNNLQVQDTIFSFHAPENNLVRPYVGGGGHVKLYTEEIGLAEIYGIIPYKHPRFKFIHDDFFAVAVIVSTGIALLTLFGNQSVTTGSTGHSTYLGGETHQWGAPYGIGVENVLRTPGAAPGTGSYDTHLTTATAGGTANVIAGILQNNINAAANGAQSGSTGVINIAATIATIVVAGLTASYTFLQALQVCIDIMYEMINFHDCVIQLNSHSFYNSHANVVNTNVPGALQPSITRPIAPQGAKYVSSGLQDFNSTQRINNNNRNKFLAIQTQTSVPFTFNVDNSKQLIADPNNISKIYTQNTASYYGAIKVDYENQYGQLQAIVQIPTNSCVYSVNQNVLIPNSTSQIFGGDVYVNRYTEKNTYYFFNTWLIDVPNGTEWNYKNYVNGPLPTYWLDSTRYDASRFDVALDWSAVIFPQFNFNSPGDYYDLDTRGQVNTGQLVNSSFYDSWMYLSFSGVRDFFTESELNVAFRDYGEEPWEKFYDPIGNSFTDLDTMFRSDLITRPIYYEYDLSLSASKLYSNFASWSNILPRDYDPTLYETCFQYLPKRVVYSLQQQEGLKRDNWRNYLQNNYRDFGGKISTVKSLNAQGAIILYEDAEPTQFVGVDTLQTQGGVKFTIGDAGLFQQNMQSLVNADDAFKYGTCISSKSAVNTPYGLFWVSQQTGKIVNYTGGGMNEISKDGMKYWFLENLPSPLLKKYPDFPLYDNVVEGISIQTVFDSQYDLLYFTKKDYKPTAEFDAIANCLVYVNGDGFYVNDSLCYGAAYIYNCPAGYTYNSISGVCEKNVVTSICALDGFVYNPDTGFCENTQLDPPENSPASPCSEDCITDIEENTCTCIVRAPAVLGPVLTKIDIKDFLEEIRWTVSYDPKLKIWLSFHDWHPEWVMPSYDHFLTIKSGQSTTAVCPPGYTFDPNTLQCIKTVSNVELAQVTISEVAATVTPDTEPCLIDIVIAMDVSGSTNTGNRIQAQRQFVQDFLNSSEISAGMTAGDIQVGFTRWSSGQNSMQPLGFSMSNTVTAAAVATYYNAAPGGGTNICNGFAGASVVLADRAGSQLGDRSASPSFRSIMLFMTDAVANNEGGNPSNCGAGSTAVGCVLQGTANTEVYSIFCDPTSPTLPGGAVALLNAITCNVTANQFTVVADGSFPNNTTDFVANAVAGSVCVLPPICSCPPGYTLIGACSETNPPICKKVTCKCPTVCEPGAEVSTTGACDDVLQAGNPGYINQDPLVCLSSYTLIKPASNSISKIWRHNVRTDSFANYYGDDYPWEIEYSVVTPNTITTLRNFEYTLDVYKYYNDGKDFNHILDENFDRAIIFNSEQNSGLLKLNLKTKNNPLTLLTYPVVNIDSIDIQFSKEENKFRFNQFYDVTADRGEFTNNTVPMWITAADGYHKIINPAYVNYAKQPLQHKKFRHYGNKIILRKNISNDRKMILKFVNNKYLLSPR